jgi:hypothetical protein
MRGSHRGDCSLLLKSHPDRRRAMRWGWHHCAWALLRLRGSDDAARARAVAGRLMAAV